MAFEVGKRVVAESESIDRRPRSGVVEEVLRGRSVASLSDPLGRRPRDHLYARQRRPPGRTTPQDGNGKQHHGNADQPEMDNSRRTARDQTARTRPMTA